MNESNEQIGNSLKEGSKEKHSQEAEQSTKPDSSMMQILELLYREFRMAVINMLKALVEGGQYA
jgi:hypothetical protein